MFEGRFFLNFTLGVPLKPYPKASCIILLLLKTTCSLYALRSDKPNLQSLQHGGRQMSIYLCSYFSWSGIGVLFIINKIFTKQFRA